MIAQLLDWLRRWRRSVLLPPPVSDRWLTDHYEREGHEDGMLS